jgi:polysaccharide pyruvyl transferase WcaK-like protein
MFNLQQLLYYSSYLKSTLRSPAYSGFVGTHNLGDEVLWHAISDAFQPLKLVYYLQPGNNLLRTLTDSKHHIFSVLGGGTLIGPNLQDGSNPFRENFQNVLTRSDDAVVFGTGVDSISSSESGKSWLWDWKSLLDRCSYIGVRGPDSVQALASIGLDKVDLLGDPACLFAQNGGYWSPRGKSLGVNVGISYPFGNEREKFLLKQLKLFIKNRIIDNWSIDLFVVCSRDLVVAKEIASEFGTSKIRINPIFDQAYPYLEKVRSVDLFVGMKLHSVILALCAGVPSIMIEYSPKCRDFMKSIDIENFSIKITDCYCENLEELMNDLLAGRDNLSVKITDQMNAYRNKQLNKAKEIVLQYDYS